MKQIIIGILVLLTVSMADPTHYIDGKWYSCDQSDYDSKGNLIHEKSSGGYELWYDYDSKVNQIHEKSSGGHESWYDYDSKGNRIHAKSSGGHELWFDYDSKGNRIHEKSSDGYESWYKYFGSKKTGQLLQCWVTKDGDPIY